MCRGSEEGHLAAKGCRSSGLSQVSARRIEHAERFSRLSVARTSVSMPSRRQSGPRLTPRMRARRPAR